jgi:hypothetical protein
VACRVHLGQAVGIDGGALAAQQRQVTIDDGGLGPCRNLLRICRLARPRYRGGARSRCGRRRTGRHGQRHPRRKAQPAKQVPTETGQSTAGHYAVASV